MTHCQALQGFPNMIQISLYKNSKINFPNLEDVLKMLSLNKHRLSVPFKWVEIMS
jgi:hypothetical protein